MPAHLHSASTRFLRPSRRGHVPEHSLLAMACHALASRCSSTVSSVTTPEAEGHVDARFLRADDVAERWLLSRDTLVLDQPEGVYEP